MGWVMAFRYAVTCQTSLTIGKITNSCGMSVFRFGCLQVSKYGHRYTSPAHFQSDSPTPASLQTIGVTVSVLLVLLVLEVELVDWVLVVVLVLRRQKPTKCLSENRALRHSVFQGAGYTKNMNTRAFLGV